ncbi:MAG: tRNA (adenosine(37)-N6)-threonylcarbamoyltransferase complex ATPase subunit type 1 TsaE [Planctomycetia bacterium]|jgi:tRNA threonylcarbamoyladenosine biosynthesis protein TsaE|nr:tRNA (adenosine(37)-N6)-threonylcarbamoyltransferase complex ATPase subunit type 1 TsaE [Planctomycetia bacterium]MCC7313642.1 tRNA (adenosine(37)-N6)-threonylcarbamoyltransferase complex ATPase subunit type 1 TsaE [Planctomycetota bacterium]OQZ04283.1 MAG: tRNA (adenosine(37)-N6)-threonylcarbamoyltransferase complex ATPase subunit type 1 TsaE [Planctomycetes bacterium UTPLA1]
MTTTLEIVSGSPDETIEIGRAIGEMLAPGDVVALAGGLGAGKTQLTKGLALGLGVSDARLVSSPTFVLINEYAGRHPVSHIDAYRLGSPTEFDALGFEEMTDGGVVIVEWADRVAAAMPSHTIWIAIEIEGETDRRLSVITTGTEAEARLAKLGAAG